MLLRPVQPMSNCRCSNPDYLVLTRPLLADFEDMAATSERDTIIAYINMLAVEWDKPVAINLRKTLFELADSLKNQEHHG
jgi:hypothetical protein